MQLRNVLTLVLAVLTAPGACFLVGCGSRTVVVADQDPSRDNLIEIVAAYSRASQQRGRPPHNLEEIKLHFLKPDQAAGILRSPNDGEPYVIAWGADVHTPPPDEGVPILLAYERKGSNGQRRVATVWGTTLILTDAEFKQARFPRGHQPPRS